MNGTSNLYERVARAKGSILLLARMLEIAKRKKVKDEDIRHRELVDGPVFMRVSSSGGVWR